MSTRVLLGAAALIASSSVSLASAQDAVGPANVTTTAPAEEASVSDPNEPRIDTELTRKTVPNVPLLVTGSVLLAGGYAPAAIAGALSAREEDEKLFYPVAGPWMTLSQGERESRGERTLLVIDGAVQGIGALAMLSSFLIPEKTTRNWYLIGSNEKLRIAPSGLGLGATGRF
jgi:hypothetical protein